MLSTLYSLITFAAHDKFLDPPGNCFRCASSLLVCDRSVSLTPRAGSSLSAFSSTRVLTISTPKTEGGHICSCARISTLLMRVYMCRLKCFVLYLQRYAFLKAQPLPIDIEFSLNSTLESLGYEGGLNQDRSVDCRFLLFSLFYLFYVLSCLVCFHVLAAATRLTTTRPWRRCRLQLPSSRLATGRPMRCHIESYLFALLTRGGAGRRTTHV